MPAVWRLDLDCSAGQPGPDDTEEGHAAGCGRKAAGLATYDARWDKPWPVLTASPRPAVGWC